MVMKQQIVFYSQNETEVLGFRVARCNEDTFEEHQLLTEIVEGEYDLCRLKIPAEEELVSLKLHRMGMPFFFSGSIRRYRTPIKSKPEGQFLHPEMTYEMYDGSQDALLMEMLKGTWGNYPLGYYRTPYLSSLVHKEREIESVFRFYKRNNLNSLRPENSIMFMNDKGNYVGFFALNHLDGQLESHIGGILEPYRKGGYFLDMLRYIKNYCVDQGLSHFAFGARNENAYVQKIFQDVGFRPIGSENVFHVLPMLAKKGDEEREIKATEGSLQEVLNHAGHFVQQQHPDFLVSGIQHSKFMDDPVKASTYVLSVPVKTEDQLLMIIKTLCQNGKIVGCYYVFGVLK